MTAGYRTFRIEPAEILKLLEDLAAPQPVRFIGHIPAGAHLGHIEWDAKHGVLEMELVHHRWPAEIDPETPVFVAYQRQYGNRGLATDWSAPIIIGADKRA